MPDLPVDDELTQLFHALCDASAVETLSRFRTNTSVDNKLDQDFDPVTEGDREAERAIRAHLAAHYGDHGVIGEEFQRVNEDSSIQWIIDPIDGTRAFISGLPVWGTLIGLYVDNVPFAGVMDQPFTRERFMAVPDQSGNLTSHLYRGSEQPVTLKTGNIDSLQDATLMTTSPYLLQNDADRSYFNLEQSVKLSRYGCDCYAYAMVACGHVDIAVESGLNIYDIAALIPIIEGAGGVVTDWQGNSAHEGGQVVAAANSRLHGLALERLNQP